MTSLQEAVMAAIRYAERKVAWPDLGSQYPPTRGQYITWKLDDYIRELEEHMKLPHEQGLDIELTRSGTDWVKGWIDSRDKMLKFLKGET